MFVWACVRLSVCLPCFQYVANINDAACTIDVWTDGDCGRVSIDTCARSGKGKLD